jgi:hypothetical protein
MRNDVREAIAEVQKEMTEPSKQEVVVRLEDANELAWAAETADGLRDRTLFLVLDEDGHLRVREGKAGSDQEIRRIRTESHQPNRRKVLEVNCEVDGWGKPVRLPSAEHWDAVFWTESSIEKFLYPYYHAQRLWDEKMDWIREEFNEDPEAVAIAHQAPSNSRIPGDSIALSTIGIARFITRDGVPSLEWLSGAEYLVVRGRQ